MRLTRPAKPALLPFVKRLWLADEPLAPPRGATAREHVLPTGRMHLVFRLSSHSVHLFGNAQDAAGVSLGRAVVGGPRSSYYVKEVSGPACSIGVQLRPGAAGPLFGAPAGELAGSHFRLEDLWGRSASVAQERLFDERDPERRLDILESLLAARLSEARALHPVVAMALQRFAGAEGVRQVVAESGYSHRRFIALFHEAVGLTPKAYCRVQRFQRALAHAAADRSAGWVDVALLAGYSDQSHFNREFLEFAGVTPTRYRKISPAFSNHVTLPE